MLDHLTDLAQGMVRDPALRREQFVDIEDDEDIEWTPVHDAEGNTVGHRPVFMAMEYLHEID